MVFGVNGVLVVLMFVVFVYIGGLLGVEVGIVGGLVIVVQCLLEVFFGDDVVWCLVKVVKNQFDVWVEGLLVNEVMWYWVVFDFLGVDIEVLS